MPLDQNTIAALSTSRVPQSKELQSPTQVVFERGERKDWSHTSHRDCNTKFPYQITLSPLLRVPSTRTSDPKSTPPCPLSSTGQTTTEISDVSTNTSQPLSTSPSGYLSSRSNVAETSPSRLLASPATVLYPNTLPVDYFRGFPNSQRLVRATEALLRSQNLAKDKFRRVLAVWSGYQDDSDKSIPRVQRLSRLRVQFEHHFTDILGLIYFAHEVKERAQSKDVDLSQGQGQGWQSLGIEKTAEVLSWPLKNVRKELKKCANYMELIKEGGPGSLLRIGTNVVSLWEKQLTQEDIKSYLKYRAEHLQGLEDHDQFVSALIITGMIAYGWTYSELAAAKSNLMDCVKKHVKVDQEEIEHILRSSDSNKRQHSHSDDAGRLCKRIQLAQTFEEPPSMQQARAFKELDISSTMQPAWASKELEGFDISSTMQPAQTFEEPSMMQPVRASEELEEFDISSIMQREQTLEEPSSIMQPARASEELEEFDISSVMQQETLEEPLSMMQPVRASEEPYISSIIQLTQGDGIAETSPFVQFNSPT